MWSKLSDQMRLRDEQFFTSDDRISNSHQRCEQLGLPRDISRARDVPDVRRVEATMRYCNGFAAFASLLFETTFERIVDRRMLLILTDASARVIALHSVPGVIRAASEQGVCLGASVAEESLGTNAVSLALHDLEPAILHGEQHYCRLLHDWYCVAIPLIDSHGTLIGCVDISMSRDAALGEKFALAGFLARELISYAARFPGQSRSYDDGDDSDARVVRVHTTIQLTERQQQALTLFSKGMSYKQIARRMDLQSIKTVQEHLDAVRAKLGAGTRRDCVRIAAEYGLLKD